MALSAGDKSEPGDLTRPPDLQSGGHDVLSDICALQSSGSRSPKEAPRCLPGENPAPVHGTCEAAQAATSPVELRMQRHLIESQSVRAPSLPPGPAFPVSIPGLSHWETPGAPMRGCHVGRLCFCLHPKHPEHPALTAAPVESANPSAPQEQPPPCPREGALLTEKAGGGSSPARRERGGQGGGTQGDAAIVK